MLPMRLAALFPCSPRDGLVELLADLAGWEVEAVDVDVGVAGADLGDEVGEAGDTASTIALARPAVK